MRRRPLLAAVLAAPGAARAQGGYPSRPVTVVAPFAAGGYTDTACRLIAARLQRALGQPFVVENRTGAGGTLAAQHVARAAPDGHVLMFGSTSTYVVAPWVNRDAGYDPTTAFAPVAVTTESPMALVAAPGRGWASVAEVLDAARRRPEGLTFASAGNGSLPHLLGAYFASLTGVRLAHVPYRGGAPALNDLMAGHVDLFFEVAGTVAGPVEGGRAAALLVTSAARSPLLPGAPTLAEAGLPADLALTSWTGLVAPAGTPEPVVAALAAALDTMLAEPELRRELARNGLDAVGGGPAPMAARIAREGATYRRIVASAGITAG